MVNLQSHMIAMAKIKNSERINNKRTETYYNLISNKDGYHVLPCTQQLKLSNACLFFHQTIDAPGLNN